MYKVIQQYLGDSWTAYRSAFKESLKADVALLRKINGQLFDHTGKQLRPMLTLLVSKAICGECPESVIRSAVAVELLHTATLLHDDVVDKSLFRRGFPTVNSMYGETSAVLIGDFWLSKALEMVMDVPDRRVLGIFSNSLTLLAEGEMIQYEKSLAPEPDEDAYFEIIRRKTATLFETAVLSAAFSIQASDSDVAAVKGYALHFGRAFQIKDDILDYSPGLDIGKPSGQDIGERKITLPLIGALKAAPAKVSSSFLKRVKVLPETISAEALTLVREYRGLEYAGARLADEIRESVDSLSHLKECQARFLLEEIAKSLSGS